MLASLAALLALASTGGRGRDALTVSEVARTLKAPMVVVDLDEDADRAATLRFVERFRDRHYAGAPILDARQVDVRPATQGGFVFLGTLHAPTSAALARGIFQKVWSGREVRLVFAPPRLAPGGAPGVAHLAARQRPLPGVHG